LALKALVLNIVGGRDPLYRVQNWAEGVPLDLVVGKGVRAEQLNDTTLARHLDRLFDGGGEGVFNAACMRVIEMEDIDTGTVHAPANSSVSSASANGSSRSRPDLGTSEASRCPRASPPAGRPPALVSSLWGAQGCRMLLEGFCRRFAPQMRPGGGAHARVTADVHLESLGEPSTVRD
jgi:hypothetical protein